MSKHLEIGHQNILIRSLVDTDVEVAWLAYDEEYENGLTKT
jgi:hypothetical protein